MIVKPHSESLTHFAASKVSPTYRKPRRTLSAQGQSLTRLQEDHRNNLSTCCCAAYWLPRLGSIAPQE